MRHLLLLAAAVFLALLSLIDLESIFVANCVHVVILILALCELFYIVRWPSPIALMVFQISFLAVAFAASVLGLICDIIYAK
jgi:hypothetical protein